MTPASTRKNDFSRLRTPVLAAAAVAVVGAMQPARAEEPRAVIELFTSQGCSSCPPADELLAQLASDPGLITLSLHVDYWDRLGWKDTLAKHAFTERQYDYAKTRGDGEVYTPQAVINGVAYTVGSRRAGIETAADVTSRRLTVPLSLARTGGDVVVTVPAGKVPADAATPARLIALPFVASRQVAIGRGENARHEVTYTNVVRDILPLGDWTGTPLTSTIPASAMKGSDGVVVLLQTGSPRKPGAIIGVGRIGLRATEEREGSAD